MISACIVQAVEEEIEANERSDLANLANDAGGPYAIKFVRSRWATDYLTPSELKISDTPALTWGVGQPR